MEPKKFLDDYLKSKVGKKDFKKIIKKNLISEGIIDSLDIVFLSVNIKKKFDITIKFNDEKSIQLFSSYEKLLNRIKNGK
tara:strand:- start:1761 stop:2000 length:240 start_codon:yes stop_codon:yes gene_type:complete